MYIYSYSTTTFAKYMYYFKVIRKESYDTMTKLVGVSSDDKAYIMVRLLMEDVTNPIRYSLFKESLIKLSARRLWYQIELVG